MTQNKSQKPNSIPGGQVGERAAGTSNSSQTGLENPLDWRLQTKKKKKKILGPQVDLIKPFFLNRCCSVFLLCISLKNVSTPKISFNNLNNRYIQDPIQKKIIIICGRRNFSTILMTKSFFTLFFQFLLLCAITQR